MKPNPICFPKQEFRFENEGDRDFEKKRTGEIPYTNLCSLLNFTLSIRASLFFLFFFSLLSVFTVGMCNCSLFVFPPLSRVSSLLLVEGSLFIEQFEKLFPPFFVPQLTG